MKAQDIMSAPVITVGLETPIAEVARLLFEHRISAVPVVDGEGRIAGIVSEGDLLRRPELGGERQGSWWLGWLGGENQAEEYVRRHGGRARDVMSARVVTVEESTPATEIAALLERERIKRVPVIRDGQPIGIVSRANLIQTLASLQPHLPEPPQSDRNLRKAVLRSLEAAGQRHGLVNVIAEGGRVQVWGVVGSEVEREAVRVAVEQVLPAERAEYHLGVLPPQVRRALGAE